MDPIMTELAEIKARVKDLQDCFNSLGGVTAKNFDTLNNLINLRIADSERKILEEIKKNLIN